MAEPSVAAVTFLGTRDAAIAPGTFTSSLLVRLGGACVLVDAGTGASAQLYRDGLAGTELDAILLTHWHPDHVAGLPSLLRRAGGRFAERSRVPLHGPAPPSRAWWRALRSASLWPLVASLDTVVAGGQLAFGGCRVTALATAHGTPSLGWLLEEADAPGRRVVVSGDTRPVPEVRDAARGCQLLVHEATFLDRDRRRAEETGHSTAREAAELAAAAGAGALALTHVSSRYTRDEVAAEARETFPAVLLPSELDRITIDADGSASLVPAPRTTPAQPA